MHMLTYPTRDDLFSGLAAVIERDLRKALAEKELVSLCVPGGTSPQPMFNLLSRVDLDWARVRVFLNDERWVSENSDRSNTAMVSNRTFFAW